MAETILDLGGKRWPIRPLTLRDVRDIGLITAAPLPTDPVERERAGYDRMVASLVAALARGNPEVTADAIWALEIGLADLVAAYRQVLELSGMRLQGEALAGSA